MLFHDEIIYCDGKLVGRVTSGAYGYSVEKPLGMGYLESKNPILWEYIPNGNYQIDVAGELVSAKLSLTPFFDPKNARIRN